ncbi:Hypothetical predicted protein [Paramuricea clavata]|uniref:Uncharacterized protein n=1 Tax=Paramuricea clavata TaxID=317549 RepID=A0A6S7FM05_PARCT|nr:Hypothetical predicted protein [Paramuricea clavata]
MWQKTGGNGDNVRRNLYAKASGADEKDEGTQCAIFLHTIGEEALEIYDTFTFTETEQDKIQPLIQKFESYCTPNTGAQCNVLPEDIFDGIKQKPQLIATGTNLTAYGGAQVPVKGKCVLEIEQTADRKTEVEFFVVKVPNAKALIGLQTCQNLELISINQISEIQEKKVDIIEDYKDVFTGLGLVEGEEC